MPEDSIAIRQICSVSALGFSEEELLVAYRAGNPLFIKRVFDQKAYWVSKISNSLLGQIHLLKNSNKNYKDLDPSVLYALFAAQYCLENTAWDNTLEVGLNLSSSRGATQLFEAAYQNYINDSSVRPSTSPTTTLGNLSSWVANHLGLKGPAFSHSITCSSGLHALLNGVAWLKAGMSNRFMIGGTEAPLTPFSIAQFEALKIYSNEPQQLACKAFDLSKKNNTLVLGEGAVIVALDKIVLPHDIKIISFGFATEPISHHTAISSHGNSLVASMTCALKGIALTDIDAIITHSPGTIKGDMAEYRAIQNVFKNQMPLLVNNKFLLGHSFAPSGLFSLQMAYLMLKYQEIFPIAYLGITAKKQQLKKIMINAVGFGGNAVSVVVGM